LENLWLTVSSGTGKDEATASGTITIPEVAHDTDEDEYVVCFPGRQGNAYGRG
jgi:hypothetical protein